MSLKEMPEQSLCCIKFLQEHLKKTAAPPEEDFVAITKDVELYLKYQRHQGQTV